MGFERIARNLTSSVCDDASGAAAATMLESSCLSVPAVALRGIGETAPRRPRQRLCSSARTRRWACRFRHGLQERRGPDIFVFVERERDRANRADILRDIVAALAVAPRGGQHELAFFVAQIDGDAVDFRIGNVTASDWETGAIGFRAARPRIFREARGAFLRTLLPPFRTESNSSLMLQQFWIGRLVRAGGPFAQVGRIVRVVDREHRPRACDRAEAFNRFATDALRGAIGRDELGMSQPPAPLMPPGAYRIPDRRLSAQHQRSIAGLFANLHREARRFVWRESCRM